MDRVSDNAIEIINELHTERLNYESEYLPLIDCANKCSAYEDTGLEPEEIERIRSDVESGYLKSTARRYGIDINRLRELAEADRNGLCVVLDGKSRDKELICKLMRLLYWLEDSIKKKDFSPSADVVNVKHGRWEPGNSICPVCGEDKFNGLDADIWSDWTPKYCPNCGALMDLKEENDLGSAL